MLLNSAVQRAVVDALATDTLSYGNVTVAVTNVARVPIAAAFTPSRNLEVSDLVFPPDGFFDVASIKMGGTEANVIANAQGVPGLSLPEPVGGFTFNVVDESLGPVTIFGNATVLLDGGGDPIGVISSGLLPTPQVFASNGQIYQMSSVEGFIDGNMFDALAGAVPIP